MDAGLTGPVPWVRNFYVREWSIGYKPSSLRSIAVSFHVHDRNSSWLIKTPLLAHGWFRPHAKTRKSRPDLPPLIQVAPKVRWSVKALGGMISHLLYLIMRSKSFQSNPKRFRSGSSFSTFHVRSTVGPSQTKIEVKDQGLRIVARTKQHIVTKHAPTFEEWTTPSITC